MVHSSRTVAEKARDLIGRSNGRRTIFESQVYFVERMPLALKNRVKNATVKTSDKACINQMMEMMTCLEKFDQNQSMCSKEIQSFQTCFGQFRASQIEERQKKAKESGLPVGARAQFTTGEMNAYLKKFPLSTRTKQAYFDPKYQK